MKVYVMTEGEYSDYGIVGVFSSKEKCEAVRNGNRDAQCEEYDIDEIVDKRFCKQFTAAIMKESGDIVAGFNYNCLNLVSPVKAIIEEDGIVWSESKQMVEGPLIRVKSPISMEHAIKVAVEARQKWLREKK